MERQIGKSKAGQDLLFHIFLDTIFYSSKSPPAPQGQNVKTQDLWRVEKRHVHPNGAAKGGFSEAYRNALLSEPKAEIGHHQVTSIGTNCLHFTDIGC